MLRSLLILFCIFVIYYALKIVFRSAVRSYYEEDRGDSRNRAALMGEDMVQDPQCRTYIPKVRSHSRTIGGRTVHFCSEACASQYEQQNRS